MQYAYLAVGIVIGAALMAIWVDYRSRPRRSQLDLSFRRQKERDGN